MGELEEIGRGGWLCDGWVLVWGYLGLELSGFGLEFGDGGVVFGLGVFF